MQNQKIKVVESEMVCVTMNFREYGEQFQRRLS